MKKVKNAYYAYKSSYREKHTIVQALIVILPGDGIFFYCFKSSKSLNIDSSFLRFPKIFKAPQERHIEHRAPTELQTINDCFFLPIRYLPETTKTNSANRLVFIKTTADSIAFLYIPATGACFIDNFERDNVACYINGHQLYHKRTSRHVA